MWSKFMGRITIIVAFIALLAVGVIGFGPAIASTNTPQSQTEAHVYPVNKNGQTYGSSMYATSPDTKPDLIMALGVDGTKGYVLNEDLNPKLPKTPEEALAMVRNTPDVKFIPLYAKDGETVVGKFKIVKPKVKNFYKPVK